MPSLPQPAFVTVHLPPPVPQQLSLASRMPWTQQRKSARIASQDNRSSSPFLKLPQEIRHIILKMYFVSTAYRYEIGHAAANDGFCVSMCGWSSPLHSLSIYCFERCPKPTGISPSGPSLAGSVLSTFLPTSREHLFSVFLFSKNEDQDSDFQDTSYAVHRPCGPEHVIDVSYLYRQRLAQ